MKIIQSELYVYETEEGDEKVALVTFLKPQLRDILKVLIPGWKLVVFVPFEDEDIIAANKQVQMKILRSAGFNLHADLEQVRCNDDGGCCCEDD